jgi:hypothetical protein
MNNPSNGEGDSKVLPLGNLSLTLKYQTRLGEHLMVKFTVSERHLVVLSNLKKIPLGTNSILNVELFFFKNKTKLNI